MNPRAVQIRQKIPFCSSVMSSGCHRKYICSWLIAMSWTEWNWHHQKKFMLTEQPKILEQEMFSEELKKLTYWHKAGRKTTMSSNFRISPHMKKKNKTKTKKSANMFYPREFFFSFFQKSQMEKSRPETTSGPLPSCWVKLQKGNQERKIMRK